MNALLLVTLLIAQPQASKPAQAPPVEVPDQAPPVDVVLTYQQGAQQALATGRHLITYVGIPSRPSNYGYGLVCEIDSLPGYPQKCVVHSYPSNGVMYWFLTTDENGKWIDSSAKAVKAEPVPFLQPSSGPRLKVGAADGEGKAASLQYNASHRCEVCGRTVTIVAGKGPTPGTHRHDCPCGNSWFH